MTPYKKKLIEVALPLEAINRESAREKSIRHGHPSTLHLWWARRPLAACRAVLFASLVDDPSSRPEEFPTPEEQEDERQRLFRLIEELVKWENSSNEEVLGAARAEIMRSTNGNPPPFLDPFAGGGSIPLEAQRLGLEAHASDLNPVAVLINKALIEIPPRFANRPPVNPAYRAMAHRTDHFRGAQGLAEDVRYYGRWMRDEAERRIGHLYPKATLPPALGGGEATVIAWLWARTVTCPNPACGARMPLVRSFVLSSKAGKEAWAEPVIDRSSQPPKVGFRVRTGPGAPAEGTVGRKGASCVACNTSVPLEYIRVEGRAGRLGAQLMAVVAEGNRSRVYLPPDEAHEEAAASANPKDYPVTDLPERALSFRVQAYGMDQHWKLFTPRQLVALTTFSDLVLEARAKALEDARAAGMSAGGGLESGGDGAQAYADAMAVYLSCAVSKGGNLWSSITSWMSDRGALRETFARQAIPMVWDFAEANPLSESGGNFVMFVDRITDALEWLPSGQHAYVTQHDAASSSRQGHFLISTDPPYYDNIGYADLSDFFYVWLRRSLSMTYPALTSTLLVPKAQELVATPYRFEGSRARAQRFFEEGLGHSFGRMIESACADYPLTVFYAFKQAESDDSDSEAAALETASTGWETMLEGLLKAGFQITGTWPVRTESSGRMSGIGTNALASSIVLVCRPRPDTAPVATRREFLAALRRELPGALRELQSGFIAPVDLAQAAIGPGMAVFSRYSRVLENDGSVMRVRAALATINTMLDEVLAEQEGEFDSDTRWTLAWFEQYGLDDGPFGQADVLSRAKNTSVAGMERAGILRARGGKVRLLRRDELPEGWDPTRDRDVPVWEATQHLIRSLEVGGEPAAASMMVALGSKADLARDLAYRLYILCERKKWAQEAMAYNSLVTAWPELTKIAVNTRPAVPSQRAMF